MCFWTWLGTSFFAIYLNNKHLPQVGKVSYSTVGFQKWSVSILAFKVAKLPICTVVISLWMMTTCNTSIQAVNCWECQQFCNLLLALCECHRNHSGVCHESRWLWVSALWMQGKEAWAASNESWGAAGAYLGVREFFSLSNLQNPMLQSLIQNEHGALPVLYFHCKKYRKHSLAPNLLLFVL